MRNNLKGINSLQLIEALIGIAWLIVTLVCLDFETACSVTWICLTFGVISFLLVGAVIFFFLQKYNADAVEVSVIPFYFSGIYLVISVAVNTVIPIIHKATEEAEHSGALGKISFIINVSMLATYIMALILAYTYVMRINRSMTDSLERKSLYNDILASLSSLKDIVQDAEIKKDVDNLHELVAYSSNITKNSAWETEERILFLLNEMTQIVASGESRDAMKNKIQEATVLWKRRNRG